jgi:hypothetical protein
MFTRPLAERALVLSDRSDRINEGAPLGALALQRGLNRLR